MAGSITPRLLEDSVTFQAALAAVTAQITQTLPSNITAFLASLPNETTGVSIPSGAVYISGDGLIKIKP